MAKYFFALALVTGTAAVVLMNKLAPWQTSDAATTAQLAPHRAAIAVNIVPASAVAPANALSASAPASAPLAAAMAAAPAESAASAAADTPPSGAVAAAGDSPEESSEPDVEDCGASPYGCPCPEQLSEIPITAPKGMKLASVNGCGMKGEEIYSGSFAFEGEVTLTGTIRYESNDMFDTLSFSGSDKQGTTYGFGFNEEGSALKAPQLSGDDRCWAAPAVIKVKRIEDIVGYTDEAGTWVRDYELLKLGQYRKCKPQ